MKNMNKKNPPQKVLPISTAREELRISSIACTDNLARSVARLTSADAQPCLEYCDEVLSEHNEAERLLYLQHCRAALEQCIANGGAQLHYHRADGTVITTRFRRVSHGRVKIWGLA